MRIGGVAYAPGAGYGALPSTTEKRMMQKRTVLLGLGLVASITGLAYASDALDELSATAAESRALPRTAMASGRQMTVMNLTLRSIPTQRRLASTLWTRTVTGTSVTATRASPGAAMGSMCGVCPML